jgi:hypothetical protein
MRSYVFSISPFQIFLTGVSIIIRRITRKLVVTNKFLIFTQWTLEEYRKTQSEYRSVSTACITTAMEAAAGGEVLKGWMRGAATSHAGVAPSCGGDRVT